MAEKPIDTRLLGLTARIVAAHAANNPLEANGLPAAIREIYQVLATIDEAPAPPEEKPQPAVPVRKSVFPDYIICLEDGKQLKMLKRHLLTAFKMTPDQYREKWGLDASYPMVAPNYAEKRSALAKQIGLGTRKPAEPAG
jgi:predicted transcriptional regulator